MRITIKNILSESMSFKLRININILSLEEFYNFTSMLHLYRRIICVNVRHMLMICVSFEPELKVRLNASSFAVDVFTSPVNRLRLTGHCHPHVIFYVKVIVEHQARSHSRRHYKSNFWNEDAKIVIINLLTSKKDKKLHQTYETRVRSKNARKIKSEIWLTCTINMPGWNKYAGSSLLHAKAPSPINYKITPPPPSTDGF